MATLNRKFLKALGINDEQADAIIEAHTDVTSVLVKERDEARTKNGDSEKLTAEVEKLKQAVASAKAEGAAEVQAKFEAFKNQVQTERDNASKATAVKTALREAGVQRDDFLELLMAKVDLSTVTMDNGSIADKAFVDTLKNQYAGCFGKIENKGADPSNPPGQGNQNMSKEEFFKLPLDKQMAYANEHPGEWESFNK